MLQVLWVNNVDQSETIREQGGGGGAPPPPQRSDLIKGGAEQNFHQIYDISVRSQMFKTYTTKQ